MPVAPVAYHLASAFGRGQAHRMTRVARGALGAVHRLESVLDGQPVVTAVKELYWEIPTEAQADREVRFTRACRAAGASTSHAIRSVAGGWLTTDDAGRAWRAYAWHDGATPGWDDVPAAVWMATQAAIIHRLDWQPDDGEPAVAAHWYERIDVDWESALAPFHAEPWAVPVIARVEELTAATEFVNSVASGPSQWCHRDLNPTNVIVNGSDVHLVDWDNAGPLDPTRDLAEVFQHVLHLVDDLPAVYAAYLNAGGTARVTGPESLVTGTAIYLNFLRSQVDVLGQPDTDPIHREFALAAVRDTIPSAWTVAHLKAAAAVLT